MSKCKNNCCCNCSCNATPVCGPLYQMNPVRMAPVCMPVAHNTAPSYMPMPSYNNGGCRNGSFGGGFGGGGICTLLIFLLILGNTGLLENRNALTLILLFWCCGGFGCGNNRSFGCGC